MTTGTISIPNVDATLAQSFLNFIKQVSALGGGSFTPDIAVSLPFNARMTIEGDSIGRGTNGPAYIQFFSYLSRGRFFFPYGYNQAFGGDTALNMASPAEIALVTATRPAFVVYMSGINDLMGSTDTPQTIFSNQRQAVMKYGVPVFFITTLQSTNSFFVDHPERETDRQALVALQRAQNDVVVVNMEGIWNPETMTVDKLHPNYLGAMTIGQALWEAVAPFATPTEDAISHSFDQSNLMLAADNPQFIGTGGVAVAADGATGVVPDGWTLDVQAGSGVSVVAAPTMLNGNNAVELTVSGSNKLTTTALVTLRNVIDITGDTAGDVYESWWDFTVAETKNLALLSVTSGNTTAMPIVNVFPTTTYVDGSAFAGVARNAAAAPNQKSNVDQPAEIVSPGGLSSISAAFQIVFPPAAADGTPTECGGTYVVAAPTLRRVPAPH